MFQIVITHTRTIDSLQPDQEYLEMSCLGTLSAHPHNQVDRTTRLMAVVTVRSRRVGPQLVWKI
jgi:hypothetical protein